MLDIQDRARRRHAEEIQIRAEAEGDKRTAFQRDYDRILYTSDFRRLGTVTQVVHADEPRLFHNRLTHSLKVAQVARRAAEYLISDEIEERVEAVPNPSVVEAAGLAHDIGHPPFGHAAENELKSVINEIGTVADPFEGNAQSFRILTKIATRKEHAGLDLTCATLNAVLKYPWVHGEGPAGFESKWGCYTDDRDYFEWVRNPLTDDDIHSRTRRTIEASVLDWADTLTYAIHDLTDFYKQGLIPLHSILNPDTDHEDSELFNEWCVEKLQDDPEAPNEDVGDIIDTDYVQMTLTALWADLPIAFREIRGRYRGEPRQRKALSEMTSRLITDFLSVPETIEIVDGQLEVNPGETMRVKILANLTEFFVYENPSVQETNLLVNQKGQKKIIRRLFGVFREEVERAIEEGQSPLLPLSNHEIIQEARIPQGGEDLERKSVRIACDAITRLTDRQARDLYNKIEGTVGGPLRSEFLD